MHIHIDPIGGMAGDMFLAAALDGDLIDPEILERGLTSLGVGSVRILQEKTDRGAIVGTHVRFEGWNRAADRDHRHLSTIIEMLESSDLPKHVRTRSQQMFETLGRVESEIHGIPLRQVHFHECGALDSIFDFVSAAWIIEHLDATWSIAPISTGQGTVETDHGTIPVPVPATARLLEGFELAPRSERAELVTPTGATILRTLRDTGREVKRPPGVIQRTGWGAGTRRLDQLSNVVRFLVTTGEQRSSESSDTSDVVRKLSFEIDDMNPELVAHAEKQFLAAGALDVVREPVLMKKGRQGTRISILCLPDDEEEIVELLFQETSTFGVRIETVSRKKLARSIEEVETEYGRVQIKIGYWGGTPIKAAPEYDDCAHLASKVGVPAQTVFRAAERKAADFIGI